MHVYNTDVVRKYMAYKERMKRMDFLKKKALLAAAVVSMSCAFSAYLPVAAEAAGYLAPQEQAIKVLPIDNAKFLPRTEI